MAYVLVPPLPRGARKSDYVPLEQLLPMRERRGVNEETVRAGDNSGSAALAAALQGAFENNASGAGRTDTQNARRRLRRGDKHKAAEPVKPVEPIEVIDEEDEDEEERERETPDQGPATLAHALSAAFAHNSANPNVTASSMAETSGGTRQLRRSTRAEVVSDSPSVEIIPAPPAKHSRDQPRPRITRNADNGKNKSPPTPSLRRRNEKRKPLTPSSPQKKRRRLARRGDDSDAHDAGEDGEVEIVGRTQQQRGNSRSKADPPRRKSGHTSQQRDASINPISVPASERSPSPTPTPPPQSPSASPPPRDELPLTILPVPSPADIMISSRALYHLNSSPGPPGRLLESRTEGEGVGGAQTRHVFLQGFHGEEAAVGAHGLLVSPAAATTTVDSSVRATTINTTADDLHHPTMNLGLDLVPMDIEQKQVQERQDAVRAAVVPPHALRISSAAHPDGPMLGFALSEHEHEGAGRSSLSADPDSDVSSDGFGLGFGANTGQNMVFTMAPLNPCFSDGATGSIDWGAAACSSTGLVPGGDYVGDGTIDPSVLGGPGAGSPYKIFKSDAAAASVRGRAVVRASNADKILDEEEDVEGLLFQDPADGEFVPPPSKGKGKVRVVGGADDAGRRIDAGDVRIRTKSWRKALAEENEESEANTDIEVNESAAAEMLSTATYCHHCRCKSTRPKMRCTRIRASTGTQCCKLYCNSCIEKRYVCSRLSLNPMHDERLNWSVCV
jgi:hypothetical protein